MHGADRLREAFCSTHGYYVWWVPPRLPRADGPLFHEVARPIAFRGSRPVRLQIEGRVSPCVSFSPGKPAVVLPHASSAILREITRGIASAVKSAWGKCLDCLQKCLDYLPICASCSAIDVETVRCLSSDLTCCDRPAHPQRRYLRVSGIGISAFESSASRRRFRIAAW